MKKNLMNKMSFLLVLMLVAALASGCTKKNSTATTPAETAEVTTEQTAESEITEAAETEAAETEAVEYKKVGEGDTVFYFVATDGDGNSQYFEVSTSETTVGAALLALGMIEGEDSDYGLYVKTVNGITADYDTDGTYWAFYIDGEYASTGVDATDITAGSTYSMVVSQ